MKLKTVYVCTECGAQSQKWLGKCPHCGKWNTLVEEVIDTSPEEAKISKRTSMAGLGGENKAQKFGEMELPTYIRTDTGLHELDRVLGGGLVTGSVVLLSGEPGIGKSTLLMQISDALGQNRKVLYVSGEESGGQLSLRAKRLGVTGDQLDLVGAGLGVVVNSTVQVIFVIGCHIQVELNAKLCLNGSHSLVNGTVNGGGRSTQVGDDQCVGELGFVTAEHGELVIVVGLGGDVAHIMAVGLGIYVDVGTGGRRFGTAGGCVGGSFGVVVVTSNQGNQHQQAQNQRQNLGFHLVFSPFYNSFWVQSAPCIVNYTI